MKQAILIFIIFFSVCLNASIEFTQKEQKWLEKNPLIKLSVLNYWEYDNDGQNIHTQLIQLLNKYGNINIKPIRYDTWNEAYGDSLEGISVHGIMNFSWSKERENTFLYSKPYDAKPNLLIVRKENNSINSLKDLEYKSVYVKEQSITRKILENSSPTIKIIERKNINELLESLYSKNEADAILTYRIAKKDLNKYDLKIVKNVYGKYSNQHIGISKEHPELHTIINKVMKKIPIVELTQIQQKIYIKNENFEAKVKIEFTKEELNWIQENPLVKVGGEKDWAPFDFIDMDGTYTGLAKEYLDYISKLTGLKFEINVGKNWAELLEDLKNNKIDLLPAIYISKERKEELNFTIPYLALGDYYVTKKNHPIISDITSLYGKQIVAVKGYDIISWLRANHPKIKILEVDTILDALRSVDSKQSIAFINDNPSTTYHLQKNFISNLKINSVVRNRIPVALHMATNPNHKMLTHILNKAIENISIEKKREVSKRWMDELDSKSDSLNLTPKEIIWLSSKPTLKFVVDPNWLPIESINPQTKQFEGMMADILKKVAEVTGLSFELVQTKKWNESTDLIKNNKADMVAALSITPKRKKFLNFTDKTIVLSDAVIMKNHSSFITSLDGLKGLRVGVSDNTSLHNMLKNEYPSLILIPTKGIKNGLVMLDGDKIDAFIGNLEVASHMIFQKSFFDLKVVFKLDRTRNLHIGLNKSMPSEAKTILNKALNTISEEERQIIRQRWIGLKINEEIDYTIFYKIALGVLLLVIFFVYWNRKLNQIVEKKTSELNILLDSFDKNVIFSRTDLRGIITHASEAFCKISGFSLDELIGRPHNIVRHPDMPKELFRNMWKSLKDKKTVNVQIKNIRKDGTFYWTDGTFEPFYNNKGEHIGYNALRVDITAKKAVEELSENLEFKVMKRTEELENQKKQMESMLSVMLLPLLITSRKTRKIVYANKYAQEQYEGSFDELIGVDTSSFLIYDEQRNNILSEMESKGAVKNFETRLKTLKNNEFDALVSLVDIEFENEDCYLGIASDISEQKEREKEIIELHEKVRDSIEYASLIQHGIIPKDNVFETYFDEYFSIWEPKDIVGGDVYLFEQLRSEDGCLLMVIDCTGHGVPGAFVTMLVKAIERQIVSQIVNNPSLEVSTSWILSHFNKNIKRLLQQNSKETVSNTGFDGGILYYNKKKNIIKFSGAETPLFYIDETKTLQIIKGDRHSIGYKKSDTSYTFKEHIIELKKGMQFYISTDGYLDQNGGEKGFPFGKKRFSNLLEENYDKPFTEQKKILSDSLSNYQKDEERNDDVTVVGIKIT